MFASWPVVAHIGPESACFGLAVTGCEHRHGRIVGVQLVAGEHMLLDRVDQWSEQIACGADPASQRGARDLDTLAGVDLRLPNRGK